jgi:putative membrane protein
VVGSVVVAEASVAVVPRGVGDAMKAILTQEQLDQLAAQVAQVERSTAGELVTVVLHQSASYGGFRCTWAGAGAFLLTGLGHLLWPALGTAEMLGAQALGALLLYWLFGVPALLRFITPPAVQQAAVTARVKQLFVERGLTETRERSGVLIVLSRLERRVELLGDRGIHEHLGAAAWQTLVERLVTALRADDAYAGLSALIADLGRELTQHFPRRADDTNELPDEVVTLQR